MGRGDAAADGACFLCLARTTLRIKFKSTFNIGPQKGPEFDGSFLLPKDASIGALASCTTVLSM